MTSPTSRTPAPDSSDSPGPVSDSPRAVPAKPPEVEELADERIHRPLARRLVRLLVRTPITPNQVTLLSALVGISAGVAISQGARRPGAMLLGGALLFGSVVLDCCDGQLARLKGISSTTGAILDGIADYAVGLSVGIGASVYMVRVHGTALAWLLGLVGIASSAVQSALFDHAKTRYIARVGGGYAEREENVDQVGADRIRAWREGRHWDAFLFWVYESYSRAQHAALAIGPAPDPVAYRAANAGRMRAWTFLGIGTHFALAYLLCFLAWWWPPAIATYFLICATVLNLALVVLMRIEGRQRAA